MSTATENQSTTGAARTDALRRVFLHQDGLAVASAVAALDELGVLDKMAKGADISVNELVSGAASGAVAACVRALQSSGWIVVDTVGSGPGDATVRLAERTPATMAALSRYRTTYEAVRGELADANWADSAEVVARVAECLPVLDRDRRAVRECGLANERAEVVERHLEGVLAATVLPRMASMKSPTVDNAAASVLLHAFGLRAGAEPTPLAGHLAFFQPMYGLVGSYARPIFSLPANLASGSSAVRNSMVDTVDRRLNVIASGAAHRGYFHAANSVLRRIFDTKPLAGQPKAIVDVGCGDGRWLREIYDAIVRRTERGRQIDRYPLMVIGVDYNQAALDVARETLASIPCVLLPGDIRDPDGIVESIAAATGLSDDELLHMRAFVDHNRAIAGVEDDARPQDDGLPPEICVSSTGALLSRRQLMTDWIHHYRRWAKFSRRHGMVIIEGHTVAPDVLRTRAGTSHGLAFEFYHNLSGQSPLPWGSFRDAAAAAGLVAEPAPVTYPDSVRPTTSVQRFVGEGAPGM